jgi:YVTN family beta-propeller protein
MIAMPRFARTLVVLSALAASAAPALAAGPKAYVGNFKDSTVSVIDTGTERVVATVPVAAGPDGIVVSPNGRSAFVSGSSAAEVSEIDTATDSVTRNIDVGKGPQGLAMTADGKWLLVAVNGDDRVAFVDTAAHGVSATVPVPKPHTIAIRPDGRQAYVASQEPGHFALVVIDMATRAVVTQVPLDKPPRDLEFDADGKSLYLTLAGVPAVQVLDPATNQWAAPVPTGVSPHIAQRFAGMASGAVVVQGPGEVMLFDPATHASVRSIGVGKQPHWLDLSADGKKLWVSNEGSNDVSVVDLAGGPMHTVAVGNAPRKIAVQRSRARLAPRLGHAEHRACRRLGARGHPQLRLRTRAAHGQGRANAHLAERRRRAARRGLQGRLQGHRPAAARQGLRAQLRQAGRVRVRLLGASVHDGAGHGGGAGRALPKMIIKGHTAVEVLAARR